MIEDGPAEPYEMDRRTQGIGRMIADGQTDGPRGDFEGSSRRPERLSARPSAALAADMQVELLERAEVWERPCAFSPAEPALRSRRRGLAACCGIAAGTPAVADKVADCRTWASQPSSSSLLLTVRSTAATDPI
jgi:hypothetical protein